jgi:hypothetical protein
MPALEITAEMIGPYRTQLALAYLRGVMIWPDDPEQRAERMKTEVADFLSAFVAATPAASTGEDFRWADLFSVVKDAMPARAFAERETARIRHGMLAGQLFGAAVTNNARAPGKWKLANLKDDTITQTAGHDDLRISRSTLENVILPRFKPVAHLWAASLYRRFYKGDNGFPCVLDDILDFLALAQFFGREITRIKAPLRRDSLLNPNEIWSIPDELNLPVLELNRHDADCSTPD